jgi:hypothetical protein
MSLLLFCFAAALFAQQKTVTGQVTSEEQGPLPGVNIVIQGTVQGAIKFERKLELGQEGHRYYDLQRWRDVQTELSRIMAYEKTMPWAGLL